MSISTRARRARPWGGTPRPVGVPTVLLLVAPLLVLIVAAVIFGTGARPRPRARAAADVAAVPASAFRRTAAPVVGPVGGAFHAPHGIRRALVALRPTSGRALAGAAAIAVGVLVASTSAFGSFALLNSRSPVGSDITLTAGTLGLAVNGSSSATAIALPAGFAKLLPGSYFSQPITLANSGNTPGVVTVRLAAAPAPYEVRVSTAACSGGYSAAASGTLLSTADTAFGTMPGRTSATGCLQIGLAANAPALTNGTGTVSAATASATFALTFSATQPAS